MIVACQDSARSVVARPVWKGADVLCVTAVDPRELRVRAISVVARSRVPAVRVSRAVTGRPARTHAQRVAIPATGARRCVVLADTRRCGSTTLAASVTAMASGAEGVAKRALATSTCTRRTILTRTRPRWSWSIGSSWRRCSVGSWPHSKSCIIATASSTTIGPRTLSSGLVRSLQGNVSPIWSSGRPNYSLNTHRIGSVSSPIFIDQSGGR